MATSYNFKINQGSDFLMRARPPAGVYDYTGATARGMMKRLYSDASPVASFTCTTGTDSKGTYFDIAMTAVTTASIPVDVAKTVSKQSTKYCYDVEMVLSDGRVVRILEGVIDVSPEVTK